MSKGFFWLTSQIPLLNGTNGKHFHDVEEEDFAILTSKATSNIQPF